MFMNLNDHEFTSKLLPNSILFDFIRFQLVRLGALSDSVGF